MHWESTPEHVLQTALDLVGLIPVIGALKNADEIGTLIKSVAKNVDEASGVAQALGKSADDMMGASGDAFKYGDEAFKLDDDIFEFDDDVLKLSDDTGGKIDADWYGDVATEGAGDVLKDANFAQKTYRPSFSLEGQSIYSDIAGVPIKTVDDLANALKKGLIKPSDVPIDYIVRDGNVLILNTRSSNALMQAGIPRNQWNAVNRTGVEMYENMLNGQLKNNGLTSAGIPTARMTGGH